MFTFKCIYVNYMFHLPPTRAEVDEGDQIVIAKKHAPPVEFKKHLYQTEDKAIAVAIRKHPLFGSEITEVTGVVPEQPKAPEGPKPVVAKGKNDMIKHLIESKLAAAEDFTGKNAKEIVEMAKALGVTFVTEKG